MKTIVWLLIAVLAISAALPFVYWYRASSTSGTDEFHFGVACGFNSTSEVKLVVDKVKDYTDLFVIDSWDVTKNETLLNEMCDYVAGSGLKFIVYFDLISKTTYPWHREWLIAAKTRWGDKFLGIYLHDELGGKQIDEKRYFTNASDYSDAAYKFMENIAAYNGTQFAEDNGIPLFTADYALYWWDYLGGYDTVFVELGWSHNTTQQIALCRGAANMSGKDWGAIIVWKTNDPPYMGTGQQMYDDMLAAYEAGAKYVIVFDYPRYPETNPYGVLTEEHFEAMKNFNAYTHTHPRNVDRKAEGQVAFVLPKDYGWGARWQDDNIWGLWPADVKTQLIWENMNKLTEKYGFKLDIIFDDARFNQQDKYPTVYLWNATIA
jgi:hypothetical protein